MADVVLFHHAQGLTAGCEALAEALRAAGHTVHLPDLYGGVTFTDLDAGVSHARDEIGFDTIIARGRRAVDDLPEALVYAGLSLGVLPAQMLAQTRPGARGALLLHAAVPPAELGAPWPAGVPLQLHTMAADPLGDADVARELADEVPEAELFLYDGDRHLFTDSSLAAYDAAATRVVLERALALLERA